MMLESSSASEILPSVRGELGLETVRHIAELALRLLEPLASLPLRLVSVALVDLGESLRDRLSTELP